MGHTSLRQFDQSCSEARLRPFFLSATTATLLSLAGCRGALYHPAAPDAADPSAAFERLPGWTTDHVADALPVMLRSCTRLALAPPDQKLGGSGPVAATSGQAGDWQAVCAAARAVPPADEAAARAFLRSHFHLIPLIDADHPEGLFTGYYEPEMSGSREENRVYHVALMTRPIDLVEQTGLDGTRHFGRLQAGSLVPYYSRAEIDHGALRRQRLDLLYLTSPIDLFFLQVQGAGRIDLPNGHVVRVGYAGTNGQPYVPIGRTLTQGGDLSQGDVSAQTIRAWLTTHPGQAKAAMESDPAYTFFRELPDLLPDAGPVGTLGVQLTPLRSIAIDTAHIPLGAPVWIDTRDADGQPLQRLMIAQDTGAGVTGSIRADIFYGWGAAAEQQAGRMQVPGHAWLLLPNQTNQLNPAPAPSS